MAVKNCESLKNDEKRELMFKLGNGHCKYLCIDRIKSAISEATCTNRSGTLLATSSWEASKTINANEAKLLKAYG